MSSARKRQEIACQQILQKDFSVFSVQSCLFKTEIASKLTSEYLLQRYLSYIRSCTATIIRPSINDKGVEFKLFNSRLTLLGFSPPTIVAGTLILSICGGLLVERHKKQQGEFRFTVRKQADGVFTSLQLSEYCPLILGSAKPSIFRRTLYRFTQAAIHRFVTVNFFAILYKELTGEKSDVDLINVQIRDGSAI